MTGPPTINILILGDHGVGKTTLAERAQQGILRSLQERRSLTLFDQRGFARGPSPLHFQIIDDPWTWNEHDIQIDCAVVMFDVTSQLSYMSASVWIDRLRKRVDTIPTVLVGNKIDLKPRRIEFGCITLHRKREMQYFDISARTNRNIEAPFISLAAQLGISGHVPISHPRLHTIDEFVPVTDHGDTQPRILSRLESLSCELLDMILDNVLDASLASCGVNICESPGTGDFPAVLTTCKLLYHQTLDWYYRHEIRIEANLWPREPNRAYAQHLFPESLLKRAKKICVDTSGLRYETFAATHPVVNQIANVLANSHHLTRLRVFTIPHFAALPKLEMNPAVESFLAPLLRIKSRQAGVQWSGIELDPTDFTTQIGVERDGALIEAIMANNTELAQFLISHSHVNLNITDDDNRRPLHMAVRSGNNEILRSLLDTGRVDVNATDLNGVTALHFAMWEGNHVAVRLLLEQSGIRTTVMDDIGRRPTDFAASLCCTELGALLHFAEPLLGTSGIAMTFDHLGLSTQGHILCAQLLLWKILGTTSNYDDESESFDESEMLNALKHGLARTVALESPRSMGSEEDVTLEID